MRKIIVSSFLTVDGLIASHDNEVSWIRELISDEILQELSKQLLHVDTLLLGRITYEMMKQYCTSPAQFNDESSIVHHFNHADKFVFSKTLEQADWNNATLVRQLNRRMVRGWQRQSGGDMALIGSASIAQALINLELVNEFHFFVHPLVLGKGKPLFRNIRGRHALMPLRTDVYKNGVLHLSYQVPAS